MISLIREFKGAWSFLSNFYPTDVYFELELYPSTEHAYQAAKSLDPQFRRIVQRAPSAAESRRLGRQATLRADWSEVRVDIMRSLLRRKFAQPFLRDLLLGTGDAELVEGNTWGDRFWGVDGHGENMLGKLLMQVRSEIAKVPPETLKIVERASREGLMPDPRSPAALQVVEIYMRRVREGLPA